MSSQPSSPIDPEKLRLVDEVATLVYELTRLWDARMDHAVAVLAAERGLTLTARQALAVWQLGEPLSMSDLARALACDQSNITGIVDRLEREGLVSRQVDPDDRRVKRLVLSVDGQRLRDDLEGLLGAAPALAALSTADLRQLRQLLVRTRDVSAGDGAGGGP